MLTTFLSTASTRPASAKYSDSKSVACVLSRPKQQNYRLHSLIIIDSISTFFADRYLLNYTIYLLHIMYSMYSAHWPLMGWNFRYYYISVQCPSCRLGQRHYVFSCLSVYAFLCTYVHPCMPTRRHSFTSLPQAFIQKIIHGKVKVGSRGVGRVMCWPEIG